MPIVQNTTSPISGTTQSLTTLISSALRLVGSLASGDIPTPSELTDAGLIANQMLDAWSTERIMVPAVQRITTDLNNAPLSLVAGKQSYVLGPNGDFLLNRPARIDRASVLYSASQQTPIEADIEVLDDVGWEGVPNKNTPSLLPQKVWIDLSNPTVMTLWYWPVPTQANPVAFYAWTMLQQFADFVTQYSFQPGYWEAIRYNLAVRLAAEFPCDLQKLPLITKIASEAKARIGSFNAPIKEAQVDRALLPGRGRGNIFTGGPSRGGS
jgi:hypothetical protein